ncbi:MAG: UbiD family decarboxylase, partial [Dehalococcoidia bacterium]|nr:UbiD family decarboxylase [Dehalococcoidia bacterium]
MSVQDLRGWLDKVDARGGLVQVDGADWDLELGSIYWLSSERRPGPALLFDRIKGYPPGYRVLTNALQDPDNVALTLDMPLGLSMSEYAKRWRQRYASLPLIRPTHVSTGPVMENVHEGNDVNVLEFPAPLWHEKDGGRYIGTNSITITVDPDEGWVNVGTYRVMVHDEKTVSFYLDYGRDAYIQREKYFARGLPCPVAISLGHDPLLFTVASIPLPRGVSEYEYAGGIRGEPVEVIRGPVTGLPIPAFSEIVLEGVAVPGDSRPEGPFGEWTGYYGSGMREEPVIQVKAIYHRNNPIILGNAPLPPQTSSQYAYGFMRSALILDELVKAGIPDVMGVSAHPAAGASQMVAVSIKQRFPGHARQAGMIAALCHAVTCNARYVIVVDDDIDVHNWNQVIWAMNTRSDPVNDVEIVRRCWGGPLDPAIPTEEKGLHSRCIIDA